MTDLRGRRSLERARYRSGLDLIHIAVLPSLTVGMTIGTFKTVHFLNPSKKWSAVQMTSHVGLEIGKIMGYGGADAGCAGVARLQPIGHF